MLFKENLYCKKVGGIWMRKTNQEINSMYDEANIVKIVKVHMERLVYVERLAHNSA